MAIFGNKTGRVYLRRKSLQMQKYVLGGVAISLIAIAFFSQK